MVVTGPPGIFGDVDAAHPQFALVEIAERVDHRRLSGADRLDLRSDQHDARNVFFQNLIVERRTLVPNVYLLLFAHIFNNGTRIAILIRRGGNRSR